MKRIALHFVLKLLTLFMSRINRNQRSDNEKLFDIFTTHSPMRHHRVLRKPT